MLKLVFFTSIFGFLQAIDYSKPVCRALVMSGGGAKGAFEAGVLYGLFHGTEEPADKFDYDVITGVSAGAINTAGMAMYPKNQTGFVV